LEHGKPNSLCKEVLEQSNISTSGKGLNKKLMPPSNTMDRGHP